MKKILNIKWELIMTTLLGIIFIDFICTHIGLNGFNFNNVMLEVLIYGLLLAINYTVVYGFRKEFLKA